MKSSGMGASKRKSEDSLLIKTIEDPLSTKLMEFFEDLILDKFISLEKSMTLQLGCGTRNFSEKVSGKQGPWSRLIIVEPSKLLLESIRLHIGSNASGKVFFKSELDWDRLAFDDGVFQTITSVLFWDRAPNRFRMFHEMSRVLAPSGMALLTAYLKGSTREFFDLYAEVITQFDMPHLAQPLQNARNMLLSKEDYQLLAEECGFGMTKVSEHSHKLQFENSKEFFSSPLIRSHWLPLWEKIAEKDSERIFWHIRQSMDRYFSGRKIPLTIVGGLIVAIK